MVIEVQHGSPQEVVHELGEGGPLQVLHLSVHEAHVRRVLLHVALGTVGVNILHYTDMIEDLKPGRRYDRGRVGDK